MIALREAQRPLLWLGHGIRLAGAVDLIDPVLDHLGIPAIVSWAGRDMSAHPLIYGSAGVYGNRVANHLVQRADFILAIGTRLSILQTGYDLAKFAPDAQVVVVDIDAEEAFKHPRFHGVVQDAREFMQELLALPVDTRPLLWRLQCDEARERFPVIEECHADPPGYISPYLFLKRLEPYLKPDQVIVTDSGGALLCAHSVLNLKPPQRLITTTGLGEMGFGLPGAIGASFARQRGEVLCLNTDGGMMFNLQELQTIAHHQLPIKIVVFSNDGYGMIRHTQRAMGHVEVGANPAGGVSCPNFCNVAKAFDFATYDCHDPEDVDDALTFFDCVGGPLLIQVACSADQQYLPKIVGSPGHSPALDELSPLLVTS